MAEMDYYHECARYTALEDHICEPDPQTGRLIEWEHAMMYKGSKLNEVWAIVPICWWAHRGPGLVKEINRWLALNRATESDLEKIGKAVEWGNLRDRLNKKYGKPLLSTGNAPF